MLLGLKMFQDVFLMKKDKMISIPVVYAFMIPYTFMEGPELAWHNVSWQRNGLVFNSNKWLIKLPGITSPADTA